MGGKIYQITHNDILFSIKLNIEWLKSSFRSYSFFQLSDDFDKVGSIIMINFLCKITTLPLGSQCNKNWWVTQKFGTTIQDTWFQDRSVTLECKNKGK